jgi:hypothetical protein
MGHESLTFIGHMATSPVGRGRSHLAKSCSGFQKHITKLQTEIASKSLDTAFDIMPDWCANGIFFRSGVTKFSPIDPTNFKWLRSVLVSFLMSCIQT